MTAEEKMQKVLDELDSFCGGAIRVLSEMKGELKTIGLASALDGTNHFRMNLNGIRHWVEKLRTNYNGVLESLRKLIKEDLKNDCGRKNSKN